MTSLCIAREGTPSGVNYGNPHVSVYGVECSTIRTGAAMDPELFVTENPIAAGLLGSLAAAAAGFCRPIMGALQAALIRRINRAWADDSGEGDHEERIRRTAKHLRRSTRVPLSQTYVEGHVRRTVSSPPPESLHPLL